MRSLARGLSDSKVVSWTADIPPRRQAAAALTGPGSSARDREIHHFIGIFGRTHPVMIVEAFFLVEEKRAISKRNFHQEKTFQDLFTAPLPEADCRDSCAE
jgi:hypothetical protein